MASCLNLFKRFFGVRSGLGRRWWHRLFKVVLVTSTVLIFVFSGLLVYDELSFSLRIYDVNVITNLEDFTRSSDHEITNTVPPFLALEGELGCYEKNSQTVNTLSAYSLEENLFCNPDLNAHTNDFVKFVNSNKGLRESLRESEFTAEDMHEIKAEGSLCLAKKGLLDCPEISSIIKYRRELSYYVLNISRTLAYSILIAMLWCVVWLLVYHRVILYIVYGDKKEV